MPLADNNTRAAKGADGAMEKCVTCAIIWCLLCGLGIKKTATNQPDRT